MKRILCALLVLCLFTGFLVGCSEKADGEEFAPVTATVSPPGEQVDNGAPPATPEKEGPAGNAISPMALTPEQEDIFRLLSSNLQEILLFDYRSKDKFSRIEFWVDAYEWGTLTNDPSGFNAYSGELRQLDGRLAVVIHRDMGDTRWTFTTDEGGALITHVSASLNLNARGLGALACAYASIDEPVTIRPGKDIVLHAAIYTDGSVTVYSDLQRYLAEPELLIAYPYVLLVKCRFS